MIGFQEQSRTAQAVSCSGRNLAVKEKEAEPNNPQVKRGWETLLLLREVFGGEIVRYQINIERILQHE